MGKVEDVENFLLAKTPVHNVSFFLPVVFSSDILPRRHLEALCSERSQVVFRRSYLVIVISVKYSSQL